MCDFYCNVRIISNGMNIYIYIRDVAKLDLLSSAGFRFTHQSYMKFIVHIFQLPSSLT